MTVYQISVFLENRAGQLAEIAKILGDNGIDMRAISIAETTDYGVLRLIVDQPQKTTSILLQRGFILSMTPVLVVAVQDHPGGLAPILQLIAEGSIDIEYMYSLFTHKDGKAYMVFRVSDEEKFTALLGAGMALPWLRARNWAFKTKTCVERKQPVKQFGVAAIRSRPELPMDAYGENAHFSPGEIYQRRFRIPNRFINIGSPQA